MDNSQQMQESQRSPEQFAMQGSGGMYEPDNKKSIRQAGKNDINQAVQEAKEYIIQGQVETANSLVYRKMNETIQSNIFKENSIELLPAYFILAEANICMGGSRLKKAEEFLIAAYWNLLQYTSGENDKGGANSEYEDALVSDQEIKRFNANLRIQFGRLFLARPNENKKALKELTDGIYQQCLLDGPESPYVCSSYYFLGELYKKEGNAANTRAIYSKICQIWVKFILNEDFQEVQGYNNYAMNLKDIYYLEAEQHLRDMLFFFEQQYGPHDTVTAEAQYAYGLVALKTGNGLASLEAMKAAHQTLMTNLGEFDRKTKEVEDVIMRVEEQVRAAHDQ